MKKILSSLCGALLITSISLPLSVSAEESIILKVHGMYCQLCLSPAITKIKRLSGVQSAVLWLQDAKIKITPTGGNKLSVSSVKDLLDSSTYDLVAFEFRANGRVENQDGGLVFIANDTGNRYPLTNNNIQKMSGYATGDIDESGRVTIKNIS